MPRGILLSSLILAILFASGQQRTIPGYRGIWFTLGQFSEYGDKYSGGLGTYTSSHVPVAIHARKVRRTYFVYGGTTDSASRHLLIMASYFDHRTGTVPRPVVVLDKLGVDDPHDNPSLSIDDEGFIWVFVSGRNTSRPGYVYRSLTPYEIDGFERVWEGDMTYPQPWHLRDSGFLALYTRYTRGRELYWRRSADGMTWTEEGRLAGMGGHYQVSCAVGGRVYTVFNRHPGGDVDKRTDLYLAYTDDMGRSWRDIRGGLLKTPLESPSSTAMVRDHASEGRLVYLNDLNVDRRGRPVVLAVLGSHHQPGPAGDPRTWVVLHWKGTDWVEHTVCVSTHNYDMGSILTSGRRWRVIGPTEPGPQRYGTGGEMAVWDSRDEGSHWRLKSRLTSDSRYNHSYARRPLHAHRGFVAFWADGHADRLSASHLFLCDAKGRVYRLPYEMEGMHALPERVRPAGRRVRE